MSAKLQVQASHLINPESVRLRLLFVVDHQTADVVVIVAFRGRSFRHPRSAARHDVFDCSPATHFAALCVVILVSFADTETEMFSFTIDKLCKFSSEHELPRPRNCEKC